MSRVSRDEIREGAVWNGYDYALQVWVLDGIVQACGHPSEMRRFAPCCDQDRYQGLTPATARRYRAAFTATEG